MIMIAWRFIVILFCAWISAVHAQQSQSLPAGYPFVRGVLLQLHAKSGELRLKTPSGEQSFFLTPKTYIFRGQEKITADKLQPGDYLKLRILSAASNRLEVVRIKVDTNTAALPPLTPP